MQETGKGVGATIPSTGVAGAAAPALAPDVVKLQGPRWALDSEQVLRRLSKEDCPNRAAETQKPVPLCHPAAAPRRTGAAEVAALMSAPSWAQGAAAPSSAASPVECGGRMRDMVEVLSDVSAGLEPDIEERKLG